MKKERKKYITGVQKWMKSRQHRFAKEIQSDRKEMTEFKENIIEDQKKMKQDTKSV